MTRSINLLVVLFWLTQGVYGQTEYTCTPCGQPCDDKVLTSSGACAVCQMPLVPRSSVKIVNLSAPEFCAAISANPEAIIIDVRSEREFKGTTGSTYGHFRKALHINISEFAGRIADLTTHKNKEVFVYCSHSVRSARAAYLLSMEGFTNVRNLAGGLSRAEEVLNSPCYQEHFVLHKE
jgi:rhodanese-related sulfurtransferase